MTTDPQNKPLVVLVDFDGTITNQDVGDQVVIKFAEPGWKEALYKLRSGEMNVKELWAYETTLLRKDREKAAVEHSLNTAEIREGFAELIRYCKSENIPVEVCSSGMSFYVDAILEKHGFGDLPRARPEVGYDKNGHGVMIVPDGLRDCGTTVMCKCEQVWKWRRKGYRVMFVGDGVSDECAVTQADVILATSRLRDVCEGKGIAHTPFDTFHDVLEVVIESITT
jgi:2-hydroxy-3-keto-5-methylthiopentenyl-1-phosphate phosphatase